VQDLPVAEPIDVKKRSNKNLKNVKKREKNKKAFGNVIKRYLFLV